MSIKSLKKIIINCLILCLIPTLVFAYTEKEQEPNDTFANANKINTSCDYTGSIGLPSTQESEPNNWFNTATGPISPGTTLLGSISSNDNSDYFYFDVEEEGIIKIDVHNMRNIGMNWKVYKESNLNNCSAYALTSGEFLSGSFNAQPGRYYLVVYRYSGDTIGCYGLKINGSIASAVDIDTYKIVPTEFTNPIAPGDPGVEYCIVNIELSIADSANDFDLYLYNDDGSFIRKFTSPGNDSIQFTAYSGRYEAYYIQVVPKFGLGNYDLNIHRELPPPVPR